MTQSGALVLKLVGKVCAYTPDRFQNAVHSLTGNSLPTDGVEVHGCLSSDTTVRFTQADSERLTVAFTAVCRIGFDAPAKLQLELLFQHAAMSYACHQAVRHNSCLPRFASERKRLPTNWKPEVGTHTLKGLSICTVSSVSCARQPGWAPSCRQVPQQVGLRQ